MRGVGVAVLVLGEVLLITVTVPIVVEERARPDLARCAIPTTRCRGAALDVWRPGAVRSSRCRLREHGARRAPRRRRPDTGTCRSWKRTPAAAARSRCFRRDR